MRLLVIVVIATTAAFVVVVVVIVGISALVAVWAEHAVSVFVPLPLTVLFILLIEVMSGFSLIVLTGIPRTRVVEVAPRIHVLLRGVRGYRWKVRLARLIA